MSRQPSLPRLRRLRRVLLRATLFTLIALVAAGSGLWIATWLVPLPTGLFQPADRALVLVDREGREIAVVAGMRARVSEAAILEEMGTWLPRITVALEDRRFWRHCGIDFHALLGAAWRNLRSGRIVSGGSTIAQQLVKNARGRHGWRWSDKLYESLAAVRLTRVWPRERILEEYLNRIDYGNRRLGPRAAAQAYFSKEPADLDIAEAIYLAGLPQAPTRFNPWSKSERSAKRYARSLEQLVGQRVLSAKIGAELAAAPPPVLRRAPPNEAPHFVDALLARDPWLTEPGAHLPGATAGRVATTLDLALQRQVAALVRRHVDRLTGRGVGQAAAVVLDNRDGSVLALVGSADYAGPKGQNNGALLPRSCGSVLKPFLYLEAIDRRILTAASVLPDTPDAIRAAYLDYDPRNFDERYLGPVRVREALGNSLNVPAVFTLSRVGARSFFERLHDWGFVFPRGLREYGAGLILGNAEPRLIDLAAAFAGIAAEGRVPAWRLLADDPRTGRVVASPEAAAIVADMLCDDDARRRAFGRGSPLAVPVRVPCKTGTSSGFRDAWTVGATSRHTVAVWAGNFDGRPMDATSSIEAAAPLWREIVDLLLVRDDGVPPPCEGGKLVRRSVCRLTGRIPTPDSPGIVNEWFLAGTEPVESASVWLRTGPGGTRLVLPGEYQAWCASPHNFLGAEVEAMKRLIVRTPTDGGQYMMDSSLSPEQQMMLLEALSPTGAAVIWTVAGRPVAPAGAAFLWKLQPGRHVATAVSGGLSASARFDVQGPKP